MPPVQVKSQEGHTSVQDTRRVEGPSGIWATLEYLRKDTPAETALSESVGKCADA